MLRRRARLAGAAIISLAAIAAVFAAVVHHSPGTRSPRRPTLEARLTLRQLAGQRIVYAYAGLTPPPSLIAQIRAGEAAGVIFFSDNIASAAQLHAVVDEMQAANATSPVHAPLLMLTDQEGGLVRRLPGAPTLSEKEIGSVSDSVAQARAAGTGAGDTLLAAGLDVNLAPVLDVYRQAGNFIDQYGRSYSSNAATVANLASVFIKAQQLTTVAATAKHFPGLGAATMAQDTDTGPVTIDLSRQELRSVDELPYTAAIAAGVKLVMLSWARFPAFGTNAPAGLAPTIVQGELRDRLHFTGVTITDALGAGALGAYGGYAQRAVSAARAGDDLLLCSTASAAGNSPTKGIAALNGLLAGLEDRSVNRSAAEAAVARIVSLRMAP